jgi:hypothetical protein
MTDAIPLCLVETSRAAAEAALTLNRALLGSPLRTDLRLVLAGQMSE